MLQATLNGVITGSSIALLALAFQLVYLPTRVFFVALAGIYSLAPYVIRSATQQGLPRLIAIAAAVLAGAAVSIACEFAIHYSLARRHSSDVAHVVASLGIYIVLVQTIAMKWGNDTKTLSQAVIPAAQIWQISVTFAQWFTLRLALSILLVALVCLHYTAAGVRLRALADNQDMFALFGYSIRRYRLLAFALAGSLASLASFMSAADVGFTPFDGLHAVLLSVVAIIIGGRTSFAGPILGGLVVGTIRALVCYQSARWQEGATFVLLALVLALRPYGIFARTLRLEATA